MKVTLAGCALAMAIASSAHAVTISLEASDNATVQPAGPRTGTSGKSFFNLEGSNNNAFASFGVVDFNLGALAPLPGTLTGVSIQLTESNAGFTLPGTIEFFLTSQTGVSIQPANTSLNYVAAMNGAGSVDSDLAPLSSLGTGALTTTGNVNTGQVDTFPLTFAGADLTTLLTALTNGSTLRIVITPNTATTAGTFAGFSNTTLAGPTLVFEAVPEPASVGLAAMFAAAGAIGRRRVRRGSRVAAACN